MEAKPQRALDPSQARPPGGKYLSRWTSEEDAILLAHVTAHGTTNWGLLKSSGLLPYRDNKACCNRFILLKKKFLELSPSADADMSPAPPSWADAPKAHHGSAPAPSATHRTGSGPTRGVMAQVGTASSPLPPPPAVASTAPSAAATADIKVASGPAAAGSSAHPAASASAGGASGSAEMRRANDEPKAQQESPGLASATCSGTGRGSGGCGSTTLEPRVPDDDADGEQAGSAEVLRPPALFDMSARGSASATGACGATGGAQAGLEWETTGLSHKRALSEGGSFMAAGAAASAAAASGDLSDMKRLRRFVSAARSPLRADTSQQGAYGASLGSAVDGAGVSRAMSVDGKSTGGGSATGTPGGSTATTGGGDVDMDVAGVAATATAPAATNPSASTSAVSAPRRSDGRLTGLGLSASAIPRSASAYQETASEGLPRAACRAPPSADMLNLCNMLGLDATAPSLPSATASAAPAAEVPPAQFPLPPAGPSAHGQRRSNSPLQHASLRKHHTMPNHSVPNLLAKLRRRNGHGHGSAGGAPGAHSGGSASPPLGSSAANVRQLMKALGLPPVPSPPQPSLLHTAATAPTALHRNTPGAAAASLPDATALSSVVGGLQAQLHAKQRQHLQAQQQHADPSALAGSNAGAFGFPTSVDGLFDWISQPVGSDSPSFHADAFAACVGGDSGMDPAALSASSASAAAAAGKGGRSRVGADAWRSAAGAGLWIGPGGAADSVGALTAGLPGGPCLPSADGRAPMGGGGHSVGTMRSASPSLTATAATAGAGGISAGAAACEAFNMSVVRQSYLESLKEVQGAAGIADMLSGTVPPCKSKGAFAYSAAGAANAVPTGLGAATNVNTGLGSSAVADGGVGFRARPAMAASRKMHLEMERTLKRVQEGIDEFQSTWQKMDEATDVTKKEKFEGELKKELKRLQRVRDQIRSWLSTSEAKAHLEELEAARRQIEVEMERFKQCEKASKIKAFSKEGLVQQSRKDPSEKAKVEAAAFLKKSMDSLQVQIDEYEAEIETISGGKTGKKLNARVLELEGHVTKVLRLLENEEIAPEDVEALKESISWYLDMHQDEDYMADDALYDDMPFHKLFGKLNDDSAAFSTTARLPSALSCPRNPRLDTSPLSPSPLSPSPSTSLLASSPLKPFSPLPTVFEPATSTTTIGSTSSPLSRVSAAISAAPERHLSASFRPQRKGVDQAGGAEGEVKGKAKAEGEADRQEGGAVGRGGGKEGGGGAGKGAGGEAGWEVRGSAQSSPLSIQLGDEEGGEGDAKRKVGARDKGVPEPSIAKAVQAEKPAVVEVEAEGKEAATSARDAGRRKAGRLGVESSTMLDKSSSSAGSLMGKVGGSVGGSSQVGKGAEKALAGGVGEREERREKEAGGAVGRGDMGGSIAFLRSLTSIRSAALAAAAAASDSSAAAAPGAGAAGAGAAGVGRRGRLLQQERGQGAAPAPAPAPGKDRLTTTTVAAAATAAAAGAAAAAAAAAAVVGGGVHGKGAGAEGGAEGSSSSVHARTQDTPALPSELLLSRPSSAGPSSPVAAEGKQSSLLLRRAASAITVDLPVLPDSLDSLAAEPPNPIEAAATGVATAYLPASVPVLPPPAAASGGTLTPQGAPLTPNTIRGAGAGGTFPSGALDGRQQGAWTAGVAGAGQHGVPLLGGGHSSLIQPGRMSRGLSQNDLQGVASAPAAIAAAAAAAAAGGVGGGAAAAAGAPLGAAAGAWQRAPADMPAALQQVPPSLSRVLMQKLQHQHLMQQHAALPLLAQQQQQAQQVQQQQALLRQLPVHPGAQGGVLPSLQQSLLAQQAQQMALASHKQQQQQQQQQQERVQAQQMFQSSQLVQPQQAPPPAPMRPPSAWGVPLGGSGGPAPSPSPSPSPSLSPSPSMLQATSLAAAASVAAAAGAAAGGHPGGMPSAGAAAAGAQMQPVWGRAGGAGGGVGGAAGGGGAALPQAAGTAAAAAGGVGVGSAGPGGVGGPTARTPSPAAWGVERRREEERSALLCGFQQMRDHGMDDRVLTSSAPSAVVRPVRPCEVPAMWPHKPIAPEHARALFEHLGMDALFFAFYFQQSTYMQYLAARELKKQSWRFHKGYNTWFQRHVTPPVITEEYERGGYVYFDFHLHAPHPSDAQPGVSTGWCQRVKDDFMFEYQHLEDELDA
ncbi:unnamed protein product [Closterium sp. NIES-65]|nr:unnamed protein product [Closterium sp. NIES-65]